MSYEAKHSTDNPPGEQDLGPNSSRGQALMGLDQSYQAHLVLCLKDKRPQWAAWQRNPAPGELAADEPHVGILPKSIKHLVVDVDAAPSQEDMFSDLFTPTASLPTPRPGYHFYYPDDQYKTRRKGKFAHKGYGGDIIAGNAYVLLWGDGPQRLLDALQSDHRGCSAAKVIAALVGDGKAFVVGRAQALAHTPAHVRLRREQVKALGHDLSAVKVGERHQTLFDCLRYWAYSQSRGADRDAWRGVVSAQARALAATLSAPLPTGQVASLARCVASWTWFKQGHQWFDKSPEAQAARGRKGGLRSGETRQAKAGNRHLAVKEMLNEGWGQSAIARETGYSRMHVSRLARLHRQGLIQPVNSELWPVVT